MKRILRCNQWLVPAARIDAVRALWTAEPERGWKLAIWTCGGELFEFVWPGASGGQHQQVMRIIERWYLGESEVVIGVENYAFFPRLDLEAVFRAVKKTEATE